jgi:hypothetical protein
MEAAYRLGHDGVVEGEEGKQEDDMSLVWFTWGGVAAARRKVS